MSANEMIPSVGADGFPAAAHQRSEGGQTAEAEAAQLFSRVRVHVRRAHHPHEGIVSLSLHLSQNEGQLLPGPGAHAVTSCEPSVTSVGPRS